MAGALNGTNSVLSKEENWGKRKKTLRKTFKGAGEVSGNQLTERSTRPCGIFARPKDREKPVLKRLEDGCRKKQRCPEQRILDLYFPKRVPSLKD